MATLLDLSTFSGAFVYGGIGALTAEAIRWVDRLQASRVPKGKAVSRHVTASIILVSVGGLIAGLQAGTVVSPLAAAQLGIGAPLLIRAWMGGAKAPQQHRFDAADPTEPQPPVHPMAGSWWEALRW